MGRSRSRSRSRDRSSRDRRKRSRSRSRSRGRNNDTGSRNRERDQSRSIRNNETIKPESENIVKALVSETDGEISCSIEETNRIRSLLGLKPLNNEKPKERQAVDNFKAQKDEEEKRREAEKLREQITKAKNKRLLNERLKGSTLGDVVEDNDDNDKALLSAADWVRRSRKKELTDKEKADLLEKRLLEEEEENKNNYSSKDLKGIQIKHSINDFEMGESVILTLADTNVLDDNDNLNDEGPVLENVNMTDAERRIEREKKIKRSKLPAYIAYDDDEFEEPGTFAMILTLILLLLIIINTIILIIIIIIIIIRKEKINTVSI